jgi:hypothetical protein
MLKRLASYAACSAGAFALASAALAAPPNGGMTTMDAAPGSLATNQGAILCVAAVNSDATIAGGTGFVASSASLGVGNYEVIFKGACQNNVTAARGWARFVQVDTLTSGSISGITCSTADRAGNPAGVFVRCTDGAGTPLNTSFFLFVLR